MNFLNIIVPQYKETDDVVRNLLSSIYRQINIDLSEIEVVIVNDASEVKISDALINEFPNLRITRLYNDKNLGPGLTIQHGIDYSNSKYVTFIDSDDVFYENSLFDVIDGLKKSDVNVLCTAVDQENLKNGNIVHTTLTFNMLRTLHGVFMKKSYLIDNNIRFNERIRMYEDTYFVSCLTAKNDMTIVGNITYVWKYTEGSLTTTTNKNYQYAVRHYQDMMNSYIDVYKYFCEHNIQNREIYILKQIIELEAILESSYFDYEELSEKKAEYENMLYDLYVENKPVIKSIKKDIYQRVYDYQINDIKGYYKDIKLGITLDDFIIKIRRSRKK